MEKVIAASVLLNMWPARELALSSVLFIYFSEKGAYNTSFKAACNKLFPVFKINYPTQARVMHILSHCALKTLIYSNNWCKYSWDNT